MKTKRNRHPNYDKDSPERVCTVCKESKLKSEFYRKNGTNNYDSICKTCDAISKKERAAKRKQLINKIKNVPCQDCGGTFPPVCMDFDHVRGEKQFGIAMASMLSLNAVMEEITKCDIICSNCHRIRTQSRLNEKS